MQSLKALKLHKKNMVSLKYAPTLLRVIEYAYSIMSRTLLCRVLYYVFAALKTYYLAYSIMSFKKIW